MLSATFRLVAPCLQPCTALRGLTCRQLVTSGQWCSAKALHWRTSGVLSTALYLSAASASYAVDSVVSDILHLETRDDGHIVKVRNDQ